MVTATRTEKKQREAAIEVYLEDGGLFMAALEQAIAFADRQSDARLNTIDVRAYGGEMVITGTDGFRLGIARIPYDGPELESTVIRLATAVEILEGWHAVRGRRSRGMYPPISVSWCAGALAVTGSEGRRVIEAVPECITYPRYMELVPVHGGEHGRTAVAGRFLADVGKLAARHDPQGRMHIRMGKAGIDFSPIRVTWGPDDCLMTAVIMPMTWAESDV